MKHLIIFLLLNLHLQATPSRTIQSTETFLGSNNTSFATLRIVNDNMGSYYTSNTKTYLDIHPIPQTRDSKPKSTLLLDITHTIDAAHNDPKTSPPVTKTTNHQDTTILLADILNTYSNNTIHPWPKEQFKDWTTDYMLYANKLIMADLRDTRTAIFNDHQSKSPIKIVAINEHNRALFITLANDDHGDEIDITQHTIHIPKRKNQQYYDQKHRQPIYLRLGYFKDLKQARDEAAKHKLPLEIWSSPNNKNQPAYQLVLKDSSYIIKTRQTEKLEATHKINLHPILGEQLNEKVPLTP